MENTAKVLPFPSGERLSDIATETLVREAVSLKAWLSTAKERLAELHAELAKRAEFKEGSKTGTLVAAGHRVKVSLKEKATWDQKLLGEARASIGDTTFFQVFAWEYKPKSKKDLDGFLQYAQPDARKLIEQAMTTKPEAPSIKYEPLEA